MASVPSSSSSGSAHIYIGCKISLISKSDIRYEGILYSLDQSTATVALSNVNSFGTEDRRPDNPVAPRNQTYEYILFRGSDIKDILVCEPPRNDPFGRAADTQLGDPAILEVTPQAPLVVPAGHGQNSLASLTAVRPTVHEYALPSSGSALHAAPQSGATGGVHLPPSLYSNASRSHQPSDAPGRAGRADDRDGRDDAPANQHYGAGLERRRRYNDDREYGSGFESRGYHGGNDYGAGRNEGYGSRGWNRGGGGGGFRQGQGYGGSDYAPSRGGYQNRGGRGAYQRQDSNEQRRRDAYNAGASGSQESATGPTAAQTKALPEYDFENAEKVFHELESQAKKLTLNEIRDGPSEQNNDKKEEGPTDEPTRYYDPNSFFDKISCEALEKEKNAGQRPDWKRERQMNSETFGFTGYRSRNFSGGNQGRGGYRGYNRDAGQRYHNQEGGGYQQESRYRSGNQDGGYRSQPSRDRYDGAERNGDGGGYQSRGGPRYQNSTSYTSRNYGASQPPRQAQATGWSNNPRQYFRCPDSPTYRRRPQSVHFDDRNDSFEDFEDNYRRPAPTAPGQAGGRRRRNRSRGGGATENRAEQDGPTVADQPLKKRTGEPRGRSNDRQQPAKGRTFRKQRNPGAVQDQQAPANSESRGGAGPSSDAQRKPRVGGRKKGRKDEWVQYDMPINCKGLLPHDKSGAEIAAPSPVSGGTPNGGCGTTMLSLLDSTVNKDSLVMTATNMKDWPLESSGGAKEGQTDVKLDVDVNPSGIQLEAN